jgi:hypothetical protein
MVQSKVKTMVVSSFVEVKEMAERDGARPPQITVVVTPDLVERLRASAMRKGVKPSVLLRMWAIEKLNEEDRNGREDRL